MSRHLDNDKRDNILAAAVEVFGRKGFGAATIKDIATQADLAPGTVYTYFKDKEDLFTQVFVGAWEDFEEKLTLIFSQGGSIQSKLEAISSYGMEILYSMSPVMRGMYTEALKLHLLEDNLNKVCELLVTNLMPRESESNLFIESSFSFEGRKFFLHTLITGIIFTIAMSPEDKVEKRIKDVKELLIKEYINQIPQGITG